MKEDNEVKTAEANEVKTAQPIKQPTLSDILSSYHKLLNDNFPKIVAYLGNKAIFDSAFTNCFDNNKWVFEDSDDPFIKEIIEILRYLKTLTRIIGDISNDSSDISIARELLHPHNVNLVIRLWYKINTISFLFPELNPLIAQKFTELFTAATQGPLQIQDLVLDDITVNPSKIAELIPDKQLSKLWLLIIDKKELVNNHIVDKLKKELQAYQSNPNNMSVRLQIYYDALRMGSSNKELFKDIAESNTVIEQIKESFAVDKLPKLIAELEHLEQILYLKKGLLTTPVLQNIDGSLYGNNLIKKSAFFQSLSNYRILMGYKGSSQSELFALVHPDKDFEIILSADVPKIADPAGISKESAENKLTIYSRHKLLLENALDGLNKFDEEQKKLSPDFLKLTEYFQCFQAFLPQNMANDQATIVDDLQKGDKPCFTSFKFKSDLDSRIHTLDNQMAQLKKGSQPEAAPKKQTLHDILRATKLSQQVNSYIEQLETFLETNLNDGVAKKIIEGTFKKHSFVGTWSGKRTRLIDPANLYQNTTGNVDYVNRYRALINTLIKSKNILEAIEKLDGPDPSKGYFINVATLGNAVSIVSLSPEDIYNLEVVKDLFLGDTVPVFNFLKSLSQPASSKPDGGIKIKADISQQISEFKKKYGYVAEKLKDFANKSITHKLRNLKLLVEVCSILIGIANDDAPTSYQSAREIANVAFSAISYEEVFWQLKPGALSLTFPEHVISRLGANNVTYDFKHQMLEFFYYRYNGVNIHNHTINEKAVNNFKDKFKFNFGKDLNVSLDASLIFSHYSKFNSKCHAFTELRCLGNDPISTAKNAKLDELLSAAIDSYNDSVTDITTLIPDIEMCKQALDKISQTSTDTLGTQERLSFLAWLLACILSFFKSRSEQTQANLKEDLMVLTGNNPEEENTQISQPN